MIHKFSLVFHFYLTKRLSYSLRNIKRTRVAEIQSKRERIFFVIHLVRKEKFENWWPRVEGGILYG